MKPKYKEGKRVFHITKRKWGSIHTVFISEYPDGKEYEYRYEVRIDGYIWSTPEIYLTGNKRIATKLQYDDTFYNYVYLSLRKSANRRLKLSKLEGGYTGTHAPI